MNRELVHLIEQIGREKGIETEIIIDAIKAAIVSASRKRLGQLENIEAEINMDSGEISLYLVKEVVEAIDEGPETQCALEEARALNPEAALGDLIHIPVEVDIAELGRIAAQTAKQVIVQRVREAEREMVYNEYKDRENELIMGVVQRYEKGNYIIDLGKAEAILPYREQSFREQFHRGDRLRAYVLEVRNTARGPQIVLSRTHPGLLIKLFEMEVPEVYEGIVEIKEAVREPSGRAKIAVHSKDRDIDPVGACVGVRGSRVQAIVQELRGEKIDIIGWSEDDVKFATNALSPAKISKIFVHEEEKKMEVIVPEDQLSLAIGKKGQNVRLAAKLTHWKIDIKSEEEYKREQDEIAFAAAEALLGPRRRPGEISIEQLPGVGGKTAEMLQKAGLSTVAAIAAAALEELMALPGIGKKKAEALRTAAVEMSEEVSEPESPPAGPLEESPPPSLTEEAHSANALAEKQPDAEAPTAGEKLEGQALPGEPQETVAPLTDPTDEPAEPAPDQQSTETTTSEADSLDRDIREPSAELTAEEEEEKEDV